MLALSQAYMTEFDLVIGYKAGKENLFTDTLSRNTKYSLNPTEELHFIPESINPTEHITKVHDIPITINNLSISPVPKEFMMVSHGSINFKDRNCNYNKSIGRDESLGHHLSCHYLDDGNDVDYEDYNNIKEEDIAM